MYLNIKHEENVKKGTIYSLQAIRTIAFLGIFLSHCGVGKFGAWGVSVFVILSGFLMMYSNYEKKIECNIKKCIIFSVNKIKKLYILHVVMTIIAFILIIPVIKADFSLIFLIKEIVKMLLNLLLLQTWIPNSKIYFSMNGVSWYLSMSLFLYFFFPVLKKIIFKIKNKRKIILLAFLIYVFQCLFSICLYFSNIEIKYSDNFYKWLTYICPIFRLGDFTIGSCLGYVLCNCKISINKYLATISEVVIILFIVIAQYFYNNKIGYIGSEAFRYNMLYTFSSVLIIMMFFLNEGLFSKICTNPFFIHIGNISSFAFLIHQIIIRCIDLTKVSLNIELNKFTYSVIAFSITMIISELLYKKKNNCTFPSKKL